MEDNYKNLVTRYGILLGTLLALVTVLAYSYNPVFFTKVWLGILIILIVLIVGTLAVLGARKIIPGHLNFRQAFTSFFIPVAIGTFISTIVSIILFNYVDPDTAGFINEEIIEVTRERLLSGGTSADTVDKELAKMEGKNPFAIEGSLKSYVFFLAFYSFIGLLVALIFRQKEPHKAQY